MKRDYLSKRYCAWRAKVKKRDKHRCKLCNLEDNRRPYPDHNLEVHHIIRWKDDPKSRFKVSNGITLCVICHLFITGREDIFAPAFKKLILNV